MTNTNTSKLKAQERGRLSKCAIYNNDEEKEKKYWVAIPKKMNKRT